MKTVMKYSLLAAVAAAALVAGTARADYAADIGGNPPARSYALSRGTEAAAMSPAAQGLAQAQERGPGGVGQNRENTESGEALNDAFHADGNGNSPEGGFYYWVSGENGGSKCILTQHVFVSGAAARASALNDPGKSFVSPNKIDLRQLDQNGIRLADNGQDSSAPWILSDQHISFIGDGRAVLDACATRERPSFTQESAHFVRNGTHFVRDGAHSVGEGEPIGGAPKGHAHLRGR
jgi:hypothetical protein